MRSYWRNYFESTDGLVWVVDSADRLRLEDCRKELRALLLEEVRLPVSLEGSFFYITNLFHLVVVPYMFYYSIHITIQLHVIIHLRSFKQRLAGATLLVFANKQDLPGALSKDAIREVFFPYVKQ